MNVLGIETSCDETAVCILEAEGDISSPRFTVLGNALYSQVKIHAEYGGVFPNLAKREHAKNLVPLLKKALEEGRLHIPRPSGTPFKGGSQTQDKENIQKILSREPGLYDLFIEFINSVEKPAIDLITVTSGPGLEPALWVGINFALALGMVWDIPVLPTNHMEGHILSFLLSPSLIKEGDQGGVLFPALALLISGGHTELVLSKSWMEYEVIGQTRDDAVGEAFDKVARLLSLPYPGGPELSKLAAEAREKNIVSEYKLPRPMITSPDFDFSFSGIKTSVLYLIKKLLINENQSLSPLQKLKVAREFEDAVTEVLIAKTKKALEEYNVKTLILGGGVTANTYIRENFKKLIQDYPDTQLFIPDIHLSTDNAIMIAIAGYLNFISGKEPQKTIIAQGNLGLS